MLYSIEITGGSFEVGIQKLSKSQFDFWTSKNNMQFLKDALLEDYSSLEGDIPDTVFFKTSYHGLCNLAHTGGGTLDTLEVEIHPISENDSDDELYRFSGGLTEFFENLTPTQFGKISINDVLIFPPKNKKTEGYLIWRAEESGFFIRGEIDVGDIFNLEKLRFNFCQVNQDTYLQSVTYDELQLEANDELDQRGYLEVEIIPA